MKFKTFRRALGAGAFVLLVSSNVFAAETQVAAYSVVDGSSIPQSLTGKPGDSAAGRELAINRKKGNCLACHVLPIPEQADHGLIAPDLTEVAGRMSQGELRLRVVDPKVVNSDTMMPAFYRKDGLHRVMKKFQGKTILNAQEVEDVVAYMMTLKGK